jgi:hypothetical protein
MWGAVSPGRLGEHDALPRGGGQHRDHADHRVHVDRAAAARFPKPRSFAVHAPTITVVGLDIVAIGDSAGEPSCMLTVSAVVDRPHDLNKVARRSPPHTRPHVALGRRLVPIGAS